MATSVGSENPLQSLISESKELNALETLARELYIIKEQDVRYLQGAHDAWLADAQHTAMTGLAAAVDISVQDQRTRLAIELKGIGDELYNLSPSALWTAFQNYVNRVEELEGKCSEAEKIAKQALIPESYWSSVRFAKSWLDLRLPKEDLHYRFLVNTTNTAKDEAFSFYVENQDKLRRDHQTRFTAIQRIFRALVRDSDQVSTTRSILQDRSHALNDASMGPISDIPDEKEIRGPFGKTMYFNYLRGGAECSPIFGSPIGSLSGAMGKRILEPRQTPLSPPLPIFMPAALGEGPTEACILAAFDIEYLWEQTSVEFDPLDTITQRDQHKYYAPKGWLLGFLLVNLPAPLLPIEADFIRHHKNHLPRRLMGNLIKRGTGEYEFFHRMWRHTDEANIKFAAEAITQSKDAEGIVSGIRGKWNIEIAQPLPGHQRWSSGDESKKWGVLSGRSFHERNSTNS